MVTALTIGFLTPVEGGSAPGSEVFVHRRAQALASYAKQIKDDDLEKLSRRIRARAMRRAGQLSMELKKAERERADKGRLLPSAGKQGKSSSLDAAGLSTSAANRCEQIACISEQDFEQAIESDDPPTVTQLTARKNPLGEPD